MLWGLSLLKALRSPFPVPDLGHVFSVFLDILLVLDQLLLELLPTTAGPPCPGPET